MSYKRPRSGDRLRGSVLFDSRFFNDAIDVVDMVKSGRHHLPRQPNTHGPKFCEIHVRNDTGAARFLGEVVQTGPASVDVPENIHHAWFDADLVDEEIGLTRSLAIVNDMAIDDGEIGSAQICGRAICKVDVSDELHRFAVPEDGSPVLQSAVAGPIEIIQDVEGTGEQLVWCNVNVAIPNLLCKATDSLSAGIVSADFLIWSGTMASGADAGYTTLPEIELQADVEDDGFFLAHWVNNGWVSPAGGGGTGGGTTLYKCLLSANLSAASGTAAIDTVTAFDGSTPPTPTSAVNALSLAGLDNDAAIIVEDTSGGSPTYYILNIKHHTC